MIAIDEGRTTKDGDQTTRAFVSRPSPSVLESPWVLAAILLLALVLRLLLWRGPLHQLANDEVEYVTVARDLLAGQGWVFYESYHWLRAPLYNLFLAGSLWLAGGDLHRAALPNIALSVGNVALSYRLAQQLVGKRAAWLAALLTAVLWTNITFASLYMAETLFTFLFLAGLVCLFGAKNKVISPLTPQPPLPHRGEGEIRLPFPTGRGWGMGARLIALSGVFFGLATLTRSASLLFLPVIAAWVVLKRTTNDERPRSRGRHFRPSSLVLRLFPTVLFLATAALTIAPWTIRNYLAYGRVIPVETGLAYNMWVFNEPRERISQIHRTLESIPNPAERSDYAMAQGMQRLREDPAILLHKLWPNWVYLARVKPIEDRFVLESYYLDPQLPLFAAALVLDDALYLVIALGGIAGLACKRTSEAANKRMSEGGAKLPTHSALSTWRSALRALQSPKALCVAWLLYAVVTMLLTHGESRYRHFLFPVLIPYAAWGLSLVTRQREGETRRNREKTFVSLSPGLLVSLSPCLLVSALLLAAFIPSYPYAWAAQHLARGWHQALGSMALALGNGDAAVRQFERAVEVQSSADAWLRLGKVNHALGRLDAAEEAFRESWDEERLWIAPSTRLGDLLRERGNDTGARDAFNGSYADEREIVEWGWRHLTPAPRSVLDVGDGLDFGYVNGVYPSENQQNATARWTNGRALLRLQFPEGGAVLRLRLAAPHPGGGGTRAEVCVAGQCQSIDVGRAWRTYTLQLPPNPSSAPLELRSDTFDGGDGRTLGLLVERAAIIPTR